MVPYKVLYIQRGKQKQYYLQMFDVVFVCSSSSLVLLINESLFPFDHLIGMLLFPFFSQLFDLLVSSSLGKLR